MGGVSGVLYWGYYMDSSFISIGKDVLEVDHVSDIWARSAFLGLSLSDGRKQKKRDELKRTRVLYSLNEDFY
jgi:hypothetical protein